MSSFKTCTPETCSIDRSIFQYRPSLGWNSAFLAIFGVFLITHAIIGFRWRTWSFTICVICGCIVEMIGYGGRIKMWKDVFNFGGFIMQIVCITIAPVFFAAGIYLTLYNTICTLQSGLARFKPNSYYIWFIVCDVISLVLQSVGGAMSSQSNGSSQKGVDIALAGLSFQVFTLTVFIYLAVDYALRYRSATKSGNATNVARSKRFQVFIAFWSLATICVYLRCCYRIAELSDGYQGPMLKKQGEFIGLEGIPIVLAVLFLHIGHPGFGLKHLAVPKGSQEKRASDTDDSTLERNTDQAKP